MKVIGHASAVILLVVACGGGPPDPQPTPGAQQLQCSGALCMQTCSTGSCDVHCNGSTECSVDCSGGATCGVIDCRGSTRCDVACSGGSPCDYIDCDHVTTCTPNCSGGSRCNVRCENDTACSPSCSGGSPCLLLCSNDDTLCAFADCSGGSGVVRCANGIQVCNRGCPACGDGQCDRIAGETCSTCPADCGHC